MSATVMVDVALSECCAEPAHQRTATRVRSQRRTALSVALSEAEEFRVERICEVFAE
jgi:hypothetical protein